jgi:ribosome-binding protein aMBF1 (putative translation factor)
MEKTKAYCELCARELPLTGWVSQESVDVGVCDPCVDEANNFAGLHL